MKENAIYAICRMERKTEPELMLSKHQVKAYSNADFSVGDSEFVNRLDKILSKKSMSLGAKSVVIDLGCGPGNITERISSRWPSCKVIGIDGSETMVEIALERKKKASTEKNNENLSYICMNIGNIENECAHLHFSADVLVSNSLLHHMHDPSKFWNCLKKLSKANCLYLHKDLRRPTSASKCLYLQKKYLSTAPEVLKKDYLASLNAAFTVKEVESQLEIAGLNHLNVLEVDDRYLEVSEAL